MKGMTRWIGLVIDQGLVKMVSCLVDCQLFGGRRSLLNRQCIIDCIAGIDYSLQTKPAKPGRNGSSLSASLATTTLPRRIGMAWYGRISWGCLVPFHYHWWYESGTSPPIHN
jgi:hypothetical protein